jgi:tetratricopeptide (TPR) repeat protein
MASGTLPETTSRFGFARLVRLQQYVNALHASLRQDPPPPGAIVYLSHAPEYFALATAGDRALRVWFRDPRMELSYITRYRPEPGQRPRRVLRFDPDRWDFARLPNPLVDAIVEGEEALARGQAATARQALGRALRIAQPGVHDVERVELQTSFGLAAYRSGDTTAARRAWQAALAIDSSHRGALLNLAALSAQRGEFGEAKRLTLAVLAESPEDPLALYYLARIEPSLGNAGAADIAWRRLAKTSPAFVDSIVRDDGAP